MSFHSQALVAGAATVQCPGGKLIRILSLACSITPGSDPAFIEILITIQGQLIARCASGIIDTSVVEISAFIGGSVPEKALSLIDPVTGAVSYSADANAHTVGLPDLWAEHEVTVSMNISSGSAGSGFLYYEMRSA